MFIDVEAKWKYVIEQLRLRQDSTNVWVAKERVWLGAERPDNASSQYEIKWINGRKERFNQHIWQITEDAWTHKCLFTFIKKKIDKMLLHLVDCNQTRFFDQVICEKTNPRKECEKDSDCHEWALCSDGHCLCNAGLAGDGNLCFDVNECQELFLPEQIKAHDCAAGQICHNSLGSYKCSDCDHKTTLMNDVCQAPTRLCRYNRCSGIKGSECIQVGDTYTCGCMQMLQSRQFACLGEIERIGASSYYANFIEENWYQAGATCELEGSELATFEDVSLGDYMEKTIRGVDNYIFTQILRQMGFSYYVWIGGSLNDNGTFVWTNGQPVQQIKKSRKRRSLGVSKHARYGGSSYSSYGSSDKFVPPPDGPAACLMLKMSTVSEVTETHFGASWSVVSSWSLMR